jgi:formamidopyrimidine-DNA glycosylase
MPELPEVESVRRGLVAARLRGRVHTVWRSKSTLRIGTSRKREGLDRLVDARAGKVHRRGKYLVWQFEDAHGDDLGLLVHLGMSGRFGLAKPTQPHAPHTHLVLGFDDDREVRFVDPRRFGALQVGTLAEILEQGAIGALGPEPLDRDFDGERLAARAKQSRRALREVLLDQTVVAGIGNIYAIEACHRAGIHPLVGAHRLQPSAWHRLAIALRDVLVQAIDNGGTTLRDFRDVSGHAGRNQDELRVYGRADAPCPKCGAILVGFVNAGRGGVFCPIDQPRVRGHVR